MQVREARAADAAAMNAVLEPILERCKSPRPRGADHVLSQYIAREGRVACSVAEDGAGRILGFQSLRRAGAENDYGLPADWGIIGTYVAGGAAGQGVGRALFARSLRAARAAGLPWIDATIGAENAEGLAYYDAMGFRNWRRLPRAQGKRFDVRR